MQAKQISNRGFLFCFDQSSSNFPQETNVYVIVSNTTVFVIDTHCGSDSMESIKFFIQSECPNHRIIVINTHYDWDHVLGNIAFSKEVIIAHNETYDHLAGNGFWDDMIHENRVSLDGDSTKCLPNMTFENTLNFPEDKVSLFHSPGHTFDSISVYDQSDQVLFVADNLELPLPYLQDHRLDLYLNTLIYYETIDYKTLICTHNGVIESQVLEKTRDYIASILRGEQPKLSQSQLELHQNNLNMIEVLKIQYEKNR